MHTASPREHSVELKLPRMAESRARQCRATPEILAPQTFPTASAAAPPAPAKRPPARPRCPIVAPRPAPCSRPESPALRRTEGNWRAFPPSPLSRSVCARWDTEIGCPSYGPREKDSLLGANCPKTIALTLLQPIIGGRVPARRTSFSARRRWPLGHFRRSQNCFPVVLGRQFAGVRLCRMCCRRGGFCTVVAAKTTT